MFEGWRVIDTGRSLMVVRGCGSVATRIQIEALIAAAQENEKHERNREDRSCRCVTA